MPHSHQLEGENCSEHQPLHETETVGIWLVSFYLINWKLYLEFYKTNFQTKTSNYLSYIIVINCYYYLWELTPQPCVYLGSHLAVSSTPPVLFRLLILRWSHRVPELDLNSRCSPGSPWACDLSATTSWVPRIIDTLLRPC